MSPPNMSRTDHFDGTQFDGWHNWPPNGKRMRSSPHSV